MAQLSFREASECIYEDGGRHCASLQTRQEEYTEGKIIPSIPTEFFDDCREILTSICECCDEGMSVAYSYLDNVLYVRIFDGERYLFPLPFMLSDDADLAAACRNLAEYTRREMIPLIISDIPRDELGILTGIFRYVDASCYEDDDDTFFIKVNNECDMCEDLPSFELDGILLDALSADDDVKYAEMCRNRTLNRFWGYDVDEDNPDAEDSYYRLVAERELSDGVAMTFAVRLDGELAGEATIYDFDYFGSAAIAVRVLPEFHGKGVGSRAMRALIEVAREIGLTYLGTEIMNENSASVKMTSKYMDIESIENDKTKFSLKL